MLTWLSDPVVRLSLLYAVGWMRLIPVVAMVVIESDRTKYGGLARLGLFAFCYAAPQAAAYLLEIEHDGRLDQIRLSGRRPMTLATTALFCVAGPWLLIGTVLTSLALLRREATLVTLVGMAAVAGVSTTLAAFSTTVQFARERIDPRIGIVGLSVVSMAIAVIGGDAATADNDAVGFPGYVIALLVESVLIGAFVRTLPKRIAHPPSGSRTRPAGAQLPAWDWLLRWPGVYRGIALSRSGFWLLGVFAPIPIVTRIITYRSDIRDIETAALYLPPLFIGAVAVSLICREDATSGRLDVVRQSSIGIVPAALQMLIGLWAPFVAATLGLVGLTAILFDLTPFGLRLGLFALMIMAPLPLIEGWSRLWPMMLMLPIAAAIGFMSIGDSWLAIGVLSAITWIAASRMLQDPERATLSGWPGIVAISAMCAVTMLPAAYDGTEIVALGTVTMMLPLSPLLIDPKSPSHRWGQPLAIAIIVLLIGTVRYGVQATVIAAVSVVAVWFASYRIRQWEPSRPIVQATIRVGLMVLLGQIAGATFRAAPGRMVQWLASFGVLAIAISLVAGVEASFRIATAIARRRSG